ncbi:FMN-binding negative transcriptional regulator [Saccharophagus degradans]|uniref:FMN-binding negative transcriptional regulator n=1 Tax=Saccharophagus degradans TaxID=86304 RepID=UPI001C08EC51|nr:FMN-binding negative transcriptional regulator [Saccharophagus degradans]MBU2984978.1 FMN-binding negative transcriptional regulator [Saccharophagus degradans]
MYIPRHFKEENDDLLLGFIRKHPFATLITTHTHGTEANHLPLYLTTSNAGNAILQGHIAAANPIWKTADQQQVLVIVQGSNAYISPNWYPTKAIDGKAVPTWNYEAVHIRGKITFIHDSDWKMQLLNDLTAEHEQHFEQPWTIADAPEEFIRKLLPAIVGFEITLDDIQGKFKLSQNQPVENKQGIAANLRNQGDPMADLIL